MALTRTVALVGMMGAGKTSIGKRLAARLAVPFADADHEIESAAGMSVADIFAKYGEGEFRRLERTVILRLLGEAPHVLATGGGAYMDDTTRAAMAQACETIWLRAPLDILLGRVKKRQGAGQSTRQSASQSVGQPRPLLDNDDMRGTLERLLALREPVYAQADQVIDSVGEAHTALVDRLVAALATKRLCEQP